MISLELEQEGYEGIPAVADALDEETKTLVCEKLLKHYEQDVIVTHKGNLNIVTITAARRKKTRC